MKANSRQLFWYLWITLTIKMKLYQNIFLFTIVLVSCSGATLNTTLPQSMFLIGTADGKDLYGDRTAMYWNQAKSYCASVGMTMAAVDTEAKLSLLRRTHLDDYFRMWTSGRDAQKLRMISWDGTNEMPDLEEVSAYYGEYQVCLLGESYLDHFSFALDLCRKEMQILCEIDAE